MMIHCCTNRMLLATLAVTISMIASARAADQLGIQAVLKEDRISVIRPGQDKPLLVQHARADFRPYIHPITAPDGKGVLTQFRPSHHLHQTGLYWGFMRANNRDFFYHPEKEYWRRKSVRVVQPRGEAVVWEVVYDLLGERAQPILTEKHTWTIRDLGDRYVLDLDWQGTAVEDMAFDRVDYGGLFLRMPWKDKGTAVNSEGQKNAEAEGQRARWVDVGMPIEGRTDDAHIAIMDHPKNEHHPLPWRVDSQLGVGPCRSRLGNWKLTSGKTARFRHRFLIYTGKLDADAINKNWNELKKSRRISSG